ncbi:MAG: hypothetical protein K9J12_07980 [Melioribacteraceae bacterium]|nr:hypothetical protein [Melioribacteraceae bacterium]MCF8265906.1 hypothetical protein [Melioribacteraceae bacterium]MCF8412946.1 hypothetical protein [Melioribacteraceae bacterium]
MNIYFLVEGKSTEPLIYKNWIRFVNSEFKIVNKLEEVEDNTVFIFSSGGYPSYLADIRAAAEDIKEFNKFDLLVVGVDSEDMSYEEKYEEIDNEIKKNNLQIDYKILVQHFCIETWALGNRKFYKRAPESKTLLNFQKIFNVASKDPELLPPYESYNRSQFAEKYLKAMIRERNSRLFYKKTNPHVIADESYFSSLIDRYEKTDHIKSFGEFVKIFKK